MRRQFSVALNANVRQHRFGTLIALVYVVSLSDLDINRASFAVVIFRNAPDLQTNAILRSKEEKNIVIKYRSFMITKIMENAYIFLSSCSLGG
jgi:hypothetical protein